MLTKNELKKLRNETVLNSLFLKDYSNSLFIKEKTVYDFFDSYIEYLYELSYESTVEKMDFDDILKRFDNVENLWNYYLMYESDPLIKDNYIAVLTLSCFYGIVIYSINDSSVLAASYYNEGCDHAMHINKITKNNIFYDNTGNEYIKKDGCKYYLSEFKRRDFKNE